MEEGTIVKMTGGADQAFAGIDFYDLFWKMFHHTTEGIAIIDANGTILACNDGFKTRVLQVSSSLDLSTTTFVNSSGTEEIPVAGLPETLRLFRMPLQKNNGVANYLWIVSEKNEPKENLQVSLKNKNEELAQVNTRMEKFLYSASHDLRSPLSSILGLVNLMRLETKDTGILDYINKIESSAGKLDKIIQDLKGLTKTTYQRRKSQPVSPEELIRKIILGYHNEEQFNLIHFETEVREDYPFLSDKECVEIIFDNIIRNAIHFYDVNKVCPFVRVMVKVDERELVMEVLDNGIGIGKMHQDKIFDMFYKACYSSQGAGLGLYITKESLNHLRGYVAVESEIGFGSIFRVRIPNDYEAGMSPHAGPVIS